jgi:hypothetical protein
MKTFIFVLFFLFLNIVLAQEHKHEIKVSVGAATSAQLRAYKDVYKNSDKYDYEQDRPSQFSINYDYNYRDDRSYGLYFGYDRDAEHIMAGTHDVGTLIKQEYTLGAEWSFRYVDWGWLQTYAGFGLGIVYIDAQVRSDFGLSLEGSTSFAPAYYLKLIELKLGHRLYLNTAFGVGYKGLINLGLSFQF